MSDQTDVGDRAVLRALGQEIRTAREARGWTRADVVERLPSGIGERTLLTYEHGTRVLSIIRFLEICRVLGSTATELLDRALEKARDLHAFSLRVDLRAVLRDHRSEFASIRTWAENRLEDSPNKEVQLAPATVCEMAAAMGFSHSTLAGYLIEFTANETPPD